VEERFLVLVKLLSQSIIQFLMFIWLNLWTTICCPFHNFVLPHPSLPGFKGEVCYSTALTVATVPDVACR
jgi:hypothetical protein